MNDRNADRDAERRLARLWEATTPTLPGDDAWAAVLARIDAAVPTPAPRRRRVLPWLGLVAGVAAAVLIAVTLTAPKPPRTELAVRPWAVAGDSDVEIISIDAADLGAVVVGRPPHRGFMLLASANEVQIDDTGHDVEVRVPGDTTGSAGPMVIMPLDGGGR